MDAVGHLRLFQHHGDFVAIGGGPVMEINHGNFFRLYRSTPIIGTKKSW
jgi:hypothetical protein